jgi:allantoate deiminase
MVSGGARAVERCRALGRAPFSDMEGGLYRGWLSPAHRASVAQVAAWMEEAGMATRVDGAGNLVGRYAGSADGPPLIIASHIDSVRDGGFYDGPLGVMLGIECVSALHGTGRRTPFPIEVIAFGDEEGSRFAAAMLTSKAAAGLLDSVPAMADASGIPLSQALGEWGLSPDTLLAARHPGALAYLEAHIEQGPVLEAEALALGVVTGIAAQLRHEVVVQGLAGHAGTSAMPLRRDAMAGAAEMILGIEALARADGSDLVATVGRIEAAPGAANVIAGHVRFTIDVRAGEAARRDRAAAAILAELAAIAARRGLGLEHRLIHDLPPSPCDPVLMDRLEAALVAAGHRAYRLVSGAGHDAMNLAHLCPTAMLFIRCRDGVSHNPAEHVEPADAQEALAVMLGFIDNLGASCA